MVDDRYFELAKGSFPYEVIQWGPFPLENSLLFEQEFTTYEGYLLLKKEYKKLKGVPSPILEMRAMKDASELTLIEESARLLNQAYR